MAGLPEIDEFIEAEKGVTEVDPDLPVVEGLLSLVSDLLQGLLGEPDFLPFGKPGKALEVHLANPVLGALFFVLQQAVGPELGLLVNQGIVEQGQRLGRHIGGVAPANGAEWNRKIKGGHHLLRFQRIQWHIHQKYLKGETDFVLSGIPHQRDDLD